MIKLHIVPSEDKIFSGFEFSFKDDFTTQILLLPYVEKKQYVSSVELSREDVEKIIKFLQDHLDSAQ